MANTGCNHSLMCGRSSKITVSVLFHKYLTSLHQITAMCRQTNTA